MLGRFIDCTGDQPPENFDELPASGIFAVGTPVASAKNPEGGSTLADTEKQESVRLYATPLATNP